MNKYEVVTLGLFALVIAGVIGWCINVYKLAQMCCDIGGMLVLRAAGIFMPPLGAILGFF